MCPNACRALSFFEFNFERPRPTPVEEVVLSKPKPLAGNQADTFPAPLLQR